MVALREKKNVGPAGLANVRFLAKTVRVTFAETGESYDILPGDESAGRQSGMYVVTLSSDTTKILGLRPAAGSYIAEFESFGNRVGDVPEKKIQRGGPRQSKDGKKKWIQPDELVFVANLRITSDGLYDGLVVTTNLPYSFVPAPVGTNADLYDSKRNLERLETFLRAVGINLATLEVPFSPNVLPWLERHIKENGQSFSVTTTDKGFVDTIAALPKGFVPAKKTAKKGKK